MDQTRFGTLTTTLANATSRRAALRGVVAILAGGAGATVDVAEAATTCRRGRQTCQRNTQCCSGTCQTGKAFALRDRNRCTCEEGLEVCGNACVDTDTDMRHCGACGNRCGAGDHCVQGECRIRQQCYSGGDGFCYMTPDGREHRADGIMFVHLQAHVGEILTCDEAVVCATAYDICAMGGVECVCVRAFDFGGGYQDAEIPGSGICLPMLDNGDGETTCTPEPEETVCIYTYAGAEVAICRGSIADEGDCVAGSCAGVGDCDGPDTDCVCSIAARGLDDFPFGYFDIPEAFNRCLSYTTPVAGSCR